MSRNETNMNSNGFTDFLTFVSPVFVVAIFFLCLFRFLFRCCSCDSTSDSENQLAEGGGHTPENEVNASNINRAVMIRSPRFQPTDCYFGHGLPFMTVDSIMDGSLLEEPFPPKYEDALKMPTPTPRIVQLTASGEAMPTNNLADPPPFYENNYEDMEFPAVTNVTGSSEQPPAYSISTISSTLRLDLPHSHLPASTSTSSIRSHLGQSLPPQSLRILIARRRMSSLDSSSAHAMIQEVEGDKTGHHHTILNMEQSFELNSERPSSSFSSCSMDRGVELRRNTLIEEHNLVNNPVKLHSSLLKTLSEGHSEEASAMKPSRLKTASLSTFIPKGSSQRRRGQGQLEEKPRPKTTAGMSLSTVIIKRASNLSLENENEKESEKVLECRKSSLQSVEEERPALRPSSSLICRLNVEELEKDIEDLHKIEELP